MKKVFLVMMIFSIPLFLSSCQSQSCCGDKKEKKGETFEASAVCTKCSKNSCDQSCSDQLSDKTIPSCSLSADAQIERGEKVISKTFSKATIIRELPDGYDLVFPQSPEIVAELNEIAAFERKCCASFQWEISENAAQKQVHLKIFGSPAVKKEFQPGFERFGLAHLLQK
jgi:hypothetical protein